MTNNNHQSYRLVERDCYTTLFHDKEPIGVIINIKRRWVTKIKNNAESFVVCGRHANRQHALARLWECRFDAWHPQ